MSNNIVLLIFEGERTEQLICTSLRQHFIDKPNQTTIQTSYGFNVYKLFQTLVQDDGLTLLGIIQEELALRQNQNKRLSSDDNQVLNLKDSDVISDIYLFFDYDPHIPGASDSHISELLTQFDSSTEEGKLFISYPMIEAIRHIKDPNDKNVLFSTEKSQLMNYKKFSGNESNIDLRYQNWASYNLDIWTDIITTHLKRANYLVNEQFSLPEELIEQLDIFNSQLTKHIPNQNINVLCAIPLMLHEYYASKLWVHLNIPT